MSVKVLVAMSGGVDSSVAALLLKEQGCEVTGATMCLGIGAGDSRERRCCGPDGIADARRVCGRLDIPHYVFDMAEPFRKAVVEPFINEYEAGRTPNPCVWCNEFIKFGALSDRAQAMGFDKLATGHYVSTDEAARPPVLRRARDLHKDQSYFLYRIERSRLSKMLFPLGSLTKQRVRELARSSGLAVAQKPESQDICFVDGAGYRGFLGEAARRDGAIVHVDGRVLGRHRGIAGYTIGQRRGLGIAWDAPLFVVALNAESNTVVVGPESALMADSLTATAVHLLTDEIPPSVGAKVRYAQDPAPCTAVIDNGRLRVRFEKPQRAVTPGQSVVLYDKDIVVGGGIIDSVP